MNTENNKIIAQFMGFTFEKNLGYYDNDMLLEQTVYDQQNGNCFDELLFNQSWDWLIPVIQKCLIGEAEHKKEGNKLISIIYEGLTNISMTETHTAVVEFIKYYNKIKESKANPIHFELKKGMIIKSKIGLKAKDCNYNSPSMVSIPKDAVFKVASAENNGDLFLNLLEGICTCFPRDRKPYDITPPTHKLLTTNIIMVEGRTSRNPYDFGLALNSHWEIVTQQLIKN